MLRLVLTDSWVNFRRHWISIAVWSIFISFVILIFTFLFIQGELHEVLQRMEQHGRGGERDEIMRAAMTVILEKHHAIAGITTLGALLALWKCAGVFPLRLNKGLYVCPAGRKEKESYLRLQLGIHILLYIAYFRWFSGFLLLDNSVWLNAMHLTFLLCSMLVMGLKLWIEGKPDYLSEDVRSKEEINVNLYWMLFIIMADVIFYTALIWEKMYHPLIIGLWIIFLAVNVICLKKMWRPLMERALSYEAGCGKGRYR